MEKILEEFIEKLFAENPNMTREDMKNRLRAEKDPYRQNKERWRNSTICHRVDSFYKDKEPKLQFSSDSVPPNIEGTEIKRHPDIFKRDEPARTLTIENIEKKADDNRLSSIQNDNIAFKRELVSILKDFKQEISQSVSTMERDVAGMKQEIPKIRQELKIAEPEVEYDFLELKTSLIAEIKKKCEERGIDDESDYINDLMMFKDKWKIVDLETTTIYSEKYKNLIGIIRDAGGNAHLKLDYDDKTGQLGVEERSMGLGFRTKLLIVAGIVAAFLTGIGIASYFKLVILIPLPF